MITIVSEFGPALSGIHGADSESAAIWLLLAATTLVVLDTRERPLEAGSATSSIDVVCAAVFGFVWTLPVILLSAVVGSLKTGWCADWLWGSVRSRCGALIASYLVLLTLGRFGIDGWYAVVPFVFTYVLVEAALLHARRLTTIPMWVPRIVVLDLLRQSPYLFAQTSTALLTLLVFPVMGAWSLMMTVALILLMRWSLHLLLQIRDTYRKTIQVLLEAAEGGDPEKRGHAERTSAIARGIAQMSGMSARDVDRVAYAAMLHDLGEIAGTDRGSAASVVSGISFFSGVAPILRLCEEPDCEEGLAATESQRMGSFIVALASDIDEAEGSGLSLGRGRTALLAERIPRKHKDRVVASALRLGHESSATS